MKRETRKWIHTLAKGGVSAIPWVGGLISESLGAHWDDSDEMRDLLKVLEGRMRGQERLTAGLLEAVAEQSPEKARNRIEQLASALRQVEQRSDEPTPEVDALLDGVQKKFVNFQAFQEHCRNRFSWVFKKPPYPYFAHPYAIEAHFTGRVRQRKALTDWLGAANGPGVYVMEAIGGMGKSAVTCFWLRRDVLGERGLKAVGTEPADEAACRVRKNRRPEGVMWWSFYDSRASFAAFVAEALVYCSGGEVDPKTIPSLHERTELLLGLLQRRRVLLVFDGLERILRAYAGLGGAYQGDDVTKDEKQQYRACVDPVAGAFLRAAAAVPLAGRVLITSRLLPVELAGHDGKPLAGCTHTKLTRFDKPDAVAFFRAAGVEGTHTEIETACGRYGDHPLALRLLAGLVVGDPDRPGDINVAGDYDVADGLKPREHLILPLAYNALDEPKRRLLSRLAAFRSPMAYDAIRGIGGLRSERKLKAALRDLADRGLLFPESAPAGAGRGARHDMHPIVRQYAYDRLADKDRQSVHGRLRDYFAAAPKPRKVETLDDLEPTIELYHHTVRAGQYDEARILFYDRLNKPLYYRFGAYQTFIELSRGLFADGEDRPPRLKSEADQAWTLNALANAYSLSGRPRKAVGAFERHNAIREKLDDKTNLAIGLGNLASMAQLPLGELKAAEGHLRRRIALCREVGDEFWESVGHQQLGRLLACTGRFDEADEKLRTSTRYWESRGHSQGLCLDESYRALCALWMGQAKAALAAAGKAMTFWEKDAKGAYPVERDRIRVEWLLGAASVAWAGRERARAEALLGEAERHLHEALTGCRRINMVEMEADILLAWAAWHRLRGDAVAAGRDAGEALAIAERSEYRLTQADAHNLLARLALDAGDRTEARRHAAIAREKALCDGPPDHTYQPALQEAKRLLE